jgi:hypothetical protein
MAEAGLDTFLPVVQLLTTEAKRHQAHGPSPDGDAPIELLAALTGSWSTLDHTRLGSLLETMARSRADDGEEPRRSRAVRTIQ